MQIRNVLTTDFKMILGLACLIGTLVISSIGVAKYAPAGPKSSTSANGRFVFEVHPFLSVDGYTSRHAQILQGYPWDPDSSSSGARDVYPVGTLFRNDADGSRHVVWRRPLVNPILPLDTWISEDGSRVVTLGDYLQADGGETLLVILDDNGKVLRTHSAMDLLPTEVAFSLAFTSIGELLTQNYDHQPGFVAGGKYFKIAVDYPNTDFSEDRTDGAFFLRVHLSDGSVERLPRRTTNKAMALGRCTLKKLAELGLKTREQMAPIGSGESAWRHFVSTIMQSSRFSERSAYPIVQLRDYLSQPDVLLSALENAAADARKGKLALAIVDDAEVHRFRSLDDVLRRAPPNMLENVLLVFVGEKKHEANITRELGRLGAFPVFIDRSKPSFNDRFDLEDESVPDMNAEEEEQTMLRIASIPCDQMGKPDKLQRHTLRPN